MQLCREGFSTVVPRDVHREGMANVQYPQPENTDNPHLLTSANLQLSHETSWQAQNRYIKHNIRNA